MRKEADLFSKFDVLTRAPDEEDQLTSDIIDVLIAPPAIRDTQPIPHLINLCQRFRDSPFHKPLAISDIDSLDLLPSNTRRDDALQLLKKIGRIQVLDIS